MRLLLITAVLVLAAAPAARAGGFATVGLDSAPTSSTWDVEITVLQHGVTPLEGITPHVDISNGRTTRTFAAEPAGAPGVYRARVEFPTAGRWVYSVRDGFTDVAPHTFPAVEIAGPAPAATGGDGVDWALLAPGLVALLAAPALLLVRRRPQPA